jgi:hypothetical protein
MVPTAQMETAMFRAHGVSYAEYNQDLDTRLDVEREREKEYIKSVKFVAQQDRKLFK